MCVCVCEIVTSAREKHKSMKGNWACWDGLTQVAFKQRAEGGEGSKLQIFEKGV